MTPAALLELELADYKLDDQRPGAIAVGGAVADDPNMWRLLAAWSRYPVDAWVEPDRPRPDDRRERWLWLWQGIDYDIRDLATAAGLDIDRAQRALSAAIGMHLIFPDGTISDNASAVLFMAFERSATAPKPTGRRKR